MQLSKNVANILCSYHDTRRKKSRNVVGRVYSVLYFRWLLDIVIVNDIYCIQLAILCYSNSKIVIKHFALNCIKCLYVWSWIAHSKVWKLNVFNLSICNECTGYVQALKTKWLGPVLQNRKAGKVIKSIFFSSRHTVLHHDKCIKTVYYKVAGYCQRCGTCDQQFTDCH